MKAIISFMHHLFYHFCEYGMTTEEFRKQLQKLAQSVSNADWNLFCDELSKKSEITLERYKFRIFPAQDFEQALMTFQLIITNAKIRRSAESTFGLMELFRVLRKGNRIKLDRFKRELEEIASQVSDEDWESFCIVLEQKNKQTLSPGFKHLFTAKKNTPATYEMCDYLEIITSVKDSRRIVEESISDSPENEMEVVGRKLEETVFFESEVLAAQSRNLEEQSICEPGDDLKNDFNFLD